jgi:hypothetical protein
LLVLSVILCFIYLFITNPIGLGILLFLLRLFILILIGTIVNVWYAYILFLVYIGGLLVIFIYICIISRNFKLNKIGIWELSGIFIVGLFSSQYLFNQKIVIYIGININGLRLPLFLFLRLVVYLLICFFVIINIILRGGNSLKIAY